MTRIDGFKAVPRWISAQFSPDRAVEEAEAVLSDLVTSGFLLRKADGIFIDELRRHGLYDKTSQAFAVFLPVRSVAVMGDGRRYDYVISLRAVETIDFMTAHWARLPYDFLDVCSRRICNGHCTPPPTSRYFENIVTSSSFSFVTGCISVMMGLMIWPCAFSGPA